MLNNNIILFKNIIIIIIIMIIIYLSVPVLWHSLDTYLLPDQFSF